MLTAIRARIIVVALVVAMMTCTACKTVAAHRRGKLAHPTMSSEHTTSPARDHVQAVHEGALGGGMDVASGCGCN